MSAEYLHYLRLAIRHHEKKLEVLRDAVAKLEELDTAAKIEATVPKPPPRRVSKYEALYIKLAAIGQPINYSTMMEVAVSLGLEPNKQDLRNRVSHQVKLGYVESTDRGYLWLPRDRYFPLTGL